MRNTIYRVFRRENDKLNGNWYSVAYPTRSFLVHQADGHVFKVEVQWVFEGNGLSKAVEAAIGFVNEHPQLRPFKDGEVVLAQAFNRDGTPAGIGMFQVRITPPVPVEPTYSVERVS